MYGVLMTVLGFAFIIAAFFFYKSDKFNYSLLAIIVGGIVLRIFCASDPLLNRWDERYHALVAKNMIETPFTPQLYKKQHIEFDYMDWSRNEIWLHKQPVPLWSMAASMAIFGVDEIALRLPSLLLSTIGILLTFLIGTHFFNRKVGVIAAFFFAINGLILEISAGRVATDHVDTFFLIFIEASILSIIFHSKKGKRWMLCLAGFLCGLAILTKWLPALIVLPAYLVLNFRKQTLETLFIDMLYILLPAVLVATPWQVYTYFNYPKEFLWEQLYNFRHITETIEMHAHPWWYFVDRIRINVNEAIYLILIWYGYYLWKNGVQRCDVFLLTWMGLPLLFFSIVQTKMQGYILFTFPAYFLIMAQFIVWLEEIIKTTSSKVKRYGSGFVIFAVLLISIRYSIERIKPFENMQLEANVEEEYRSLKLSDNAIIFNHPFSIEMMFYSDIITYQKLPSEQNIEELTENNYIVYILDRGNIPSYLKNRNQVRILELENTMQLLKEKGQG